MENGLIIYQLFQMAFMADFAQATKGYIIHSYGIDITHFTTLHRYHLAFSNKLKPRSLTSKKIDSLYCNISFIEVIWNLAHNTSEVCLYFLLWLHHRLGRVQCGFLNHFKISFR